MEKPSLGATIQMHDDSTERVIVTAVDPDGVVDTGGIQSGDIIMQIGGQNPIDWIRNAVREGAVRVVVLRNGKELVRYLEFQSVPSPEPIDPFCGMFDQPATRRFPAGVQTQLVGVADNCRLLPGSPLLPARRGIDADHIEIFEARERVRAQRPAVPPMSNLAGFKWLD